MLPYKRAGILCGHNMHSKGNLDYGVGFHASQTLNIFVGQMIDNVNQL